MQLPDFENHLALSDEILMSIEKPARLSRRWCSAYLKIMVADTVISNLDKLGELEQLGGKCQKFPAKGSTHQGRWCSGSM